MARRATATELASFSVNADECPWNGETKEQYQANLQRDLRNPCLPVPSLRRRC